MAKIYSLVTDSDAGTDCELFTTKAARDARCLTHCGEAWDHSDGPMPLDWEAAWEVISQTADWWLSVQDHEIDPAKLEA